MTLRGTDPAAPPDPPAGDLAAAVAAALGFLGRRGVDRRRGHRLGYPGRPRQQSFLCGAGPAPLDRPAGLSRRADRIVSADPLRLPRRPGQRHPAGDRRAAHDRPRRHRPRAVAAHRPGQDRADPARPVLRCLDRPRGSDSADRRGHHARARPPAAPAAAGTGARAGAGRRRRRDRRRIQHAAGRRGIRHRGTQPFLRSTHLRHGADGGHRRRRHHLGAGRQLHLFRPYLGGAGFRPRLDRGGVVQPGGRPGRRIVQRGAGAVRTGVLRPVRALGWCAIRWCSPRCAG